MTHILVNWLYCVTIYVVIIAEFVVGVVMSKSITSTESRMSLEDLFTCSSDPVVQKAMHTDMLNHLKTPAGRLSNYHGRYSKSQIYAGMEDYPDVFRKDDYDRIMDEKRHKFAMRLVATGEEVLDILSQEPSKKCQNLEIIKMARDIVMGDELVKEQALAKAQMCVEFPVTWQD
jgi:hypothetical protein